MPKAPRGRGNAARTICGVSPAQTLQHLADGCGFLNRNVTCIAHHLGAAAALLGLAELLLECYPDEPARLSST